MFRHQGKTRTLKHNLKVASVLSFVAGNVNVIGFFAVQRLTTNVTGHFAFFADEVFKLNFWQGIIYFLYIISFLAGSFVSNFIVETVSKKSDRYIFILPVILECVILFTVGISNPAFIAAHPDGIACSLLFAMGLQNSLVTQISGSMVRTTHLTGLFTDLGIELSQLLFYGSAEQRKKLFSSIRLRLTIILFFFIGGISGGVLYSKMQVSSLLVSMAVLVAGLLYDNFKLRLITIKRKLNADKTTA